MTLRLCLRILTLSLVVVPVLPAGADQRIVGIAIARNEVVYAWFKDGTVTTGTSRHFEAHSHARRFTLPAGETVDDIVAMSIMASDDRVFVWYRDGLTSTGTATDLAQHRSPRPFSLPPGRTTASIVGIGIAKDDTVYTRYDDLTYTIGTPTRLDEHEGARLYSLPPGKIPSQIVEIDVAKSNNQVHTWYRDGFGSVGEARHLDSVTQSFGYIPSQVLYHWWGPGRDLPGRTAADSGPDRDPDEGLRPRLRDRDGEARLAARPDRPQPEPGGDPPEPSGPPPSGARALPFFPNFGARDAMIAAGPRFLIVSNSGSLGFYDRSGNALQEVGGLPTSLSTGEFFAAFVSPLGPDGQPNANDVSLYMNLPKPCDSPDYPQLRSGNRFCINSFYDTRVSYDTTSARFFIISNSRHDVWNKDCVDGGPKCSCYVMTLSQVPDRSICTEIEGNTCSVSTNDYCGLARRYVAFAVSKTDDPRDGFHQYVLTENNARDWPWQGVNGNHYVVAYNGSGESGSPVATVFSVQDLKAGVEHPAYFRYYGPDVNGAKAVRPVAQYESQAGRTFLLGSTAAGRLDIFGMPQSIDPWTAPPLQHASVTLGAPMPELTGAVYRRQRLYLVGSVEAEHKGQGDETVTRYRVHLFRIPLAPISGSSIEASKDPAKGFLDYFFGKRNPTDPAGHTFSYEYPSIAVNGNGDMLVGYLRRPFNGEPPLQPEARHSLWHAGESDIRASVLLQPGKSDDPGGSLDYVTTVVDPDGQSFWVALPFADTGKVYKIVAGRVVP